MPSRSSKTHWESLQSKPLRTPNGRWRAERAIEWFAKLLGLPPTAIVIRRPNGDPVDSNDSLTALRSEWNEKLS